MEVLVNWTRKRGAVVTDPDTFRNVAPDAEIVDLSECGGIYILDCTHSWKGKPGPILARQWLFGRGSKLSQLLTTIYPPCEEREAFRSTDDFKAEFHRACNPRKIGLGSKQTRLCNIL